MQPKQPTLNPTFERELIEYGAWLSYQKHGIALEMSRSRIVTLLWHSLFVLGAVFLVLRFIPADSAEKICATIAICTLGVISAVTQVGASVALSSFEITMDNRFLGSRIYDLMTKRDRAPGA